MAETRDHLADAVWMTDFANRNGYVSMKPLTERPGYYGCLAAFAYTVAIILGEIGDEATMADRWCYETAGEAYDALEAWNGAGEPEGWHRHPFSGRRREKGDPATEYVRP